MVGRVGNVLPLNDRSQIREGAQGLEVAGTWAQVLAGFGVERRVETVESADVSAFAADVGGFEQDRSRELVLKARVPLLNVWRRCFAVQPEIAGQPGVRRHRKPSRVVSTGMPLPVVVLVWLLVLLRTSRSSQPRFRGRRIRHSPP